MEWLYLLVTDIHFYVALILGLLFIQAKQRVYKVYKSMLINYKAVYSKLEENARITTDLIHNNIEIHLTNVATRIISLSGDQEYIEVFKRFVFDQDITTISNFYLSYRGEPTFDVLVTKLKSRRERHRKSKMARFFMGADAKLLLSSFKYLLYNEDTKIYELASYPHFFIEELNLATLQAEEELIKELQVYKNAPLNVGIYRAIVIKVYEAKILKWFPYVISMVKQIENEYSRDIKISDLIAKNRIKEALDRLSLQNTNLYDYDTLVLIKARYTELKNRELIGDDPSPTDWANLRKTILNYAHKDIN